MPDVHAEIFSTQLFFLLRPLLLFPLLVKARCFDLINSHGCSYFGFMTVVMCHVVARVLRKKLVVVYHGAAAQDFFDRFRCLRRFLTTNQPIVVPSGFLQAVFAAYGVDCTVIPNAVDLTRFPFRARTGLSPRILSTRNLAPVYNIRGAIDALVIVQREYPNATLTIVGAGALRAELEAHVRRQGIVGVTFLGRVDNEKIPAILAEHDVFINASLQDNLPGSVLEAFASGLPVVSTNVGGIPYLVQDQVTGLLVPPDDAAALAAGITWMLAHRPEALAMALRAKESLAEYDAESVRIRWRAAFGLPKETPRRHDSAATQV
jgi:glycosyltransferase involved in cell wall biosynthesis